MTQEADTDTMLPLAMEATRLIKALAHPERLIICCHLRGGELSVGQIETQLGIPQPRLSRELGKLRTESILAARREAKAVFYTLTDDRIRAIVDTLCRVMLADMAKPSSEISLEHQNTESLP